jgi:hypothetical protein
VLEAVRSIDWLGVIVEEQRVPQTWGALATSSVRDEHARQERREGDCGGQHDSSQYTLRKHAQTPPLFPGQVQEN